MAVRRVSSSHTTPPPKGAFLSGDGKRLLVSYALCWGALLLTFLCKRKLRSSLHLQKKSRFQ